MRKVPYNERHAPGGVLMFKRRPFAALTTLCSIAAVTLTALGVSPVSASSVRTAVRCAGPASAEARFMTRAAGLGIHAQEAIYDRSLVGCIPLGANGKPETNLLQRALSEQHMLVSSRYTRRGARRDLTPSGPPWQLIGPAPIGSGSNARSGRVLSVAYDAALGGGTLFIGTAGGGVWSSRSPFTSWTT